MIGVATEIERVGESSIVAIAGHVEHSLVGPVQYAFVVGEQGDRVHDTATAHIHALYMS